MKYKTRKRFAKYINPSITIVALKYLLYKVCETWQAVKTNVSVLKMSLSLRSTYIAGWKPIKLRIQTEQAMDVLIIHWDRYIVHFNHFLIRIKLRVNKIHASTKYLLFGNPLTNKVSLKFFTDTASVVMSTWFKGKNIS